MLYRPITDHGRNESSSRMLSLTPQEHNDRVNSRHIQELTGNRVLGRTASGLLANFTSSEHANCALRHHSRVSSALSPAEMFQSWTHAVSSAKRVFLGIRWFRASLEYFDFQNERRCDSMDQMSGHTMSCRSAQPLISSEIASSLRSRQNDLCAPNFCNSSLRRHFVSLHARPISLRAPFRPRR